MRGHGMTAPDTTRRLRRLWSDEDFTIIHLCCPYFSKEPVVVLIVAMAEHFQGLTARKNVTLINLYSLILTLASPGFPQQKASGIFYVGVHLQISFSKRILTSEQRLWFLNCKCQFARSKKRTIGCKQTTPLLRDFSAATAECLTAR